VGLFGLREHDRDNPSAVTPEVLLNDCFSFDRNPEKMRPGGKGNRVKDQPVRFSQTTMFESTRRAWHASCMTACRLALVRRTNPDRDEVLMPYHDCRFDFSAPTLDRMARLSCLATVTRRLLLGALLTACVASNAAHALGLGQITQQSALGEPLRLAIPIITSAGEELSGECFKLVSSGAEGGDALPEVLGARVALEQINGATRLIVSSNRAINDPALMITVQAGCSSTVRRQYTLLMDPQPIDTPVTAAEAPSRADTVPARADTAPETRAAGLASAPSAAPAPRAPRRRVASAAGSRAAAATSKKRDVASANQAKSPSTVPAPKPPDTQARLQVSRSVLGASSNPNATGDAARQLSPQELANAVEAESAILRKRVEELTLMIERMQQDLRAEQAARQAAEQAAKAAPAVVLTRWWESNWPLLAALVALAALIAAALVWKRRRETGAAIEPITASMAPDRFESTYLGDASIQSAQVDTEFDSQPMPARPIVATAPPTEAPPTPKFELDPERAFDEDLLNMSGHSSSALERDHPTIIDKLTRDWGKPQVLADLHRFLASKRDGASAALSRDAVAELMMLHGIATELVPAHAGDSWQINIEAPKPPQ